VKILAASAVLALAVACSPAESPWSRPPESADEVIERFVEAVGGQDAIERLSTRTITGHLVHDLSWHDPQVETLDFVYQAGSDDRFMHRMTGQKGTTFEGFDGTEGWNLDRDGNLKPNPDAGRSKQAWYANPHQALRIREYFPNPQLAGTREVDGRTCYAVRCDRQPEYFTLYFDDEAYLLRAIGYHNWVEDYREVDGVLLPHRIVCGRKGGSSTFYFENIEHNLPLDDAVFSPPEE
jgi:hypothetical protein